MLEGIEIIKPQDIEKRSFEILSEIMGERHFEPMHEPIIKRVIHTTADFEYAEILSISPEAIESGIKALKNGSNIVTDTNMAASGINKKSIGRFGGKVFCFMADEDVAERAKREGTTRASVCMDKAADNPQNHIYAIGNAPTALIRLCEKIQTGEVSPALVVGVPVGFVNVVESKNLLKKAGVPYIITEGRKGGSTVAAAIMNAILYLIND